MKKFAFLLSFFLIIITIHAQDYWISFEGTGASGMIDSVKVENLTQNKSINIKGGDALHLVAAVTGIHPLLGDENTLNIYPNPASDCSTIEFVASAPGVVHVELFDITGKKISSTKNALTVGRHFYQISGTGRGIYVVKIYSPAYSYKGKLVSGGTSGSKIRINYTGKSIVPAISEILKNANVENTMQYTNGDLLKYTSTSGNYKALVTDIPSGSKTITFTFVPCTDSDGKHYPVVQIGQQAWMAENLGTTKFNDGTAIPFVGGLFWQPSSTPGYAWYGNDSITNKALYGALYNWYVANPQANGNRNVCPVDWHVPSDEEWTTLANYLGGKEVAADKIKERGSTYWEGPNMSTNETGFSARGGGLGDVLGSFHNILYYGLWWSSSEYSSEFARYMSIWCTGEGMSSFTDSKKYGFSIRCVYGAVPFVTTTGVTGITSKTAVASGNISSEGSYIISERGICYGTYENPTINSSKITATGATGEFSCTLAGLVPGSEYYVRAYAISNGIPYYGSNIKFITPTSIPILISTAASAITPTSVIVGGDVQSDGGAEISERGICYALTPNPTTDGTKVIASGTTGSFTCNLSGLTTLATYYFKAYAMNKNGTAYGDELSFKTAQENGVSDVNGNYYNTVAIGSQVWLAENLKATKYNDGTEVSLITDSPEWVARTTPAYCWYNNDSITYKNLYGALYNWQVVNPLTNGDRNICPSGWHVPKDSEWTTLTATLGGESVAGGKLKEAGLSHWASPNTGATNESKFTALPGGYRSNDGRFRNRTYNTFLWSMTE